jgi:hypothetical protein
VAILNPNRLTYTDLVVDYERILREQSQWEDWNMPVLICYDAAVNSPKDTLVQQHIREWIMRSQRAALAGHSVILEVGREVLDPVHFLRVVNY